MTDRHVVAMRCPGRPKVPVILEHPPECHQTGGCEFGRSLAAGYRKGGYWVDGVYRQAEPGGTGMERLSWCRTEPGEFTETEAEYLRRLDEGPTPHRSEAVQVNQIASLSTRRLRRALTDPVAHRRRFRWRPVAAARAAARRAVLAWAADQPDLPSPRRPR